MMLLNWYAIITTEVRLKVKVCEMPGKVVKALRTMVKVLRSSVKASTLALHSSRASEEA